MDDNKVAVLIEDLMAKFRNFGEGLDGLRDDVKQFRDETNNRFNKLEDKLTNHILENRDEFNKNHQEHQQLMQMVKELDQEVQVEIKRVK